VTEADVFSGVGQSLPS